jgi:hypothetical protein
MLNFTCNHHKFNKIRSNPPRNSRYLPQSRVSSRFPRFVKLRARGASPDSVRPEPWNPSREGGREEVLVAAALRGGAGGDRRLEEAGGRAQGRRKAGGRLRERERRKERRKEKERKERKEKKERGSVRVREREKKRESESGAHYCGTKDPTCNLVFHFCP